MALFFNKKNPVKVIINISEEGVQGVVVRSSDQGRRDVLLYSTGKKTGFAGKVNSFSEMTSCTGEVISEIAKESSTSSGERRGFGKRSIKDFIFIIESPFQYSYLTNISSENKEPVKISDESINEIIEEEEPKMPEGRVSEFWIGEKPRFVKREILQVTLNGYSAQVAHGKSARNIDLLVFNTVIPEKMFRSLHSRIKSEFNPSSVDLFASSDVNIAFLNDVSRQEKGVYKYVKVNISNTVISVVGEKKLESVYYIDKGSIDLIEEISGEFGVPRDVAMSYFSIFLAGTGERDFSERVGNVIEGVLKEWGKGYEINMDYRPKSVYLSCNSRFEEIFRDVLSKKEPENEIANLFDVYTYRTGTSIDPEKLQLNIGTYFVNRILSDR